MLSDFTFVPDVRKIKGGYTEILRVMFKGECIAIFSEEDRKQGDTITLEEQAKEYLKSHGYRAEHRRQWNNGNKINWSEDILVDISK